MHHRGLSPPPRIGFDSLSPDALQLRVSELEDAVKRKGNALKTAIQRRERTEETATADRAQAWGAAKVARVAQEEERRRGASLQERARDAETRVWKPTLFLCDAGRSSFLCC